MFIKLHYRDVEALIKLIENDIGVEDLDPPEAHAYTRLLLMRQSMLAARSAEQRGSERLQEIAKEIANRDNN